MTIKLRYLLLLLCIGPWVQGQVKIGDNPQNLDPGSILELESTSRALVISRVTTAQMSAIVPLRGAMVYNTDADCLYYYNGTTWINLCEASGGPFTFTTDPVANTGSSIIITRTGNNYNFEVGEITGRNITEGTILHNNLGDGIITGKKLQDGAVTSRKIAEGAVSSYEIENESILTDDIAPEGPDKILGTDSDGRVQWQDKSSLTMVTDLATITGTGTATDPFKVSDGITNAIAENAADIADHIADDGDTEPENELQTLAQVIARNPAANGKITNLTTPTAPQDAATKGYVDSVVDGIDGSDNQQLTLETGNILTLEDGGIVDLTPFLNTDNQTITDFTFDSASNILTLSLERGNTVTVDLSSLAGQVQDDTQVPLATPTDIDADGTQETDVQQALAALTVVAGQVQDDTQVPLATPTDIDADGTQETNVQQALAALTVVVGHAGNPGAIFFADDPTGNPTSNSDQLFWDNTNNRLGIGTATPDARLHVNGDFHLKEHLVDETNSTGTVGQVLTSTATGTVWASGTTLVVARGKVTGNGTTPGAYSVTLPSPMPNTNYIIQTTVVQTSNEYPIMIQVTSQTITDFSVQIYEFNGSAFTPVDAEWFYTIMNP